MTLVELLVAMTILVIFFAVFASVTGKVFTSTQSQQARSQNVDSSRSIVQLLDRQVRYANGINTPLTFNGSRYVTWQAGSANQQQTCYQWRVTAGGLMQYRSWLPPAATATAWTTAGNGIGANGTDPVFSLSASLSTGQSRQQLALSFTSAHGSPSVSSPTRVTLTALNTRTPSAPSPAVCQGVAPQ